MANFVAGRPAAIGAILAIATIPLHLFLSKAHSEQFAAVLLAMMGAIYAGFGLQKGSLFQILAEVAAAIGFFIGSLAALWVSPWVVPFAYTAQPIPRMEFGTTRTTNGRNLRCNPGSLLLCPGGTLLFVLFTTGWRRRLWRSFGVSAVK